MSNFFYFFTNKQVGGKASLKERRKTMTAFEILENNYIALTKAEPIDTEGD